MRTGVIMRIWRSKIEPEMLVDASLGEGLIARRGGTAIVEDRKRVMPQERRDRHR